RAGLVPYLDKLGFNLVGYGCTTCIGNSGPLPDPISAAVNSADLAVVSVLSGNRNFEGRINPDVKMNYLTSPPLVVAYALAGSMDVDITTEPLGAGSDGAPVYLHDIWPSAADVQQVVDEAIASEMFVRDYADVFAGFMGAGGARTDDDSCQPLARMPDRREHQVVEHRHACQDTRGLIRTDDAGARDAMRRAAVDALPLEDDPPGVRLERACDRAEERRLARAVRADQAGDGVRLDVERRTVDRTKRAEAAHD